MLSWFVLKTHTNWAVSVGADSNSDIEVHLAPREPGTNPVGAAMPEYQCVFPRILTRAMAIELDRAICGRRRRAARRSCAAEARLSVTIELSPCDL